MKKTNEKISIIVPCYNAAKTLDRCLMSILAQTYKNFELITVNDGSSDASAEVIKKYAETDSRILMLEIKHAGVSAARNAGIAIASGGYIHFVDADDDIEPDMLEILHREIKHTGADITVCAFTHPSIKNYLGDRVLDLTRRNDMLTFYQQTFAIQVPWNKLWRREVITELYDVEVSFCEDGLFCLANMKNARRVVSTSRELYHYFIAPKSVSSEESSCINRIAKSQNFWETHETYWYKHLSLLDKEREIIGTYNGRDAGELLYHRVFDFLLWEILILGDMGIGRYGLIKETEQILREPEFKNSIAAKEKYGISFMTLTDGELDARAAVFVDLLLYAIRDIKERQLTYRPFYVALTTFAALFIDASEDVDGSVDYLAAAFVDYELSLTGEAEYARELIESGEAYEPVRGTETVMA